MSWKLVALTPIHARVIFNTSHRISASSMSDSEKLDWILAIVPRNIRLSFEVSNLFDSNDDIFR